MTLLLLLVPAFAGEVFASIDPEITQGMGGTWARYHATEAGYWFFQVAGSDGWMEDVAEDLSGYDDRARIQLTHVATHRGLFAAGALRAARWVIGRPAGLYTLDDVLAG